METLHIALTRRMQDAYPPGEIAAQNREAAASTLTAGDRFLAGLNHGLAGQLNAPRSVDKILSDAAGKAEMREIAAIGNAEARSSSALSAETLAKGERTSFSTGNGASQAREWQS